MQARALDQRDTVLQQLPGLALDAVRRYAEQGGIDLLKLGEMPDHRQVAQPVELRGSAPHHAGQAEGRIVQQQLGAAVAEPAEADHRDLTFLHVCLPMGGARAARYSPLRLDQAAASLRL